MKTKTTGVFYHENNRCYIARISLNGSRKYLGSYQTYLQAAKARRDYECNHGYINIAPNGAHAYIEGEK